MPGHNITLFRLFGFEVRANLSWVLLAILVAWSLAAGYFPAYYPDLPQSTYWSLGILGMAGLFASLILHEMSHAMVARARGMKIGGITLFLFGGVAELKEEPPTPRIEAEVAAAGPVMSFALAGLFHLLAGALAAMGSAAPLIGLAEYLATINLVLALFNLVPGFPLDGGRLLRAFLWSRRGNLWGATRTASRVGQGFAALLMLLGGWAILTGAGLGGMWWVLIGLFLWSAARGSLAQLMAHRALTGMTVAQLMNAEPVSVPPDLPLDRFVEDYAYRHHFSLYPVTRDGRLIGAVRTRDVGRIAPGDWSRHDISTVMQPRAAVPEIGPDE
ncbi:MAG: site-2 protease family protein, partial [Rhodothalassiaceae bacterium]